MLNTQRGKKKSPPDDGVSLNLFLSESWPSFYLNLCITEGFLAATSKTSTRIMPSPSPVRLLLPFKGLWESCVLSPFPLSNSLMPRLLLDHYPNPSPQHGCQASKAAGARIWKQHVFKPSLQGRRAYAHRRREASGLTWQRKKILWTAW